MRASAIWTQMPNAVHVHLIPKFMKLFQTMTNHQTTISYLWLHMNQEPASLSLELLPCWVHRSQAVSTKGLNKWPVFTIFTNYTCRQCLISKCSWGGEALRYIAVHMHEPKNMWKRVLFCIRMREAQNAFGGLKYHFSWKSGGLPKFIQIPQTRTYLWVKFEACLWVIFASWLNCV